MIAPNMRANIKTASVSCVVCLRLGHFTSRSSCQALLTKFISRIVASMWTARRPSLVVNGHSKKLNGLSNIAIKRPIIAKTEPIPPTVRRMRLALGAA